MKKLLLICLLAASIVLFDVGAAFTQEVAAVPIGKSGFVFDWIFGLSGLAKIVEAEPGSDAFADVIPIVAANGGFTFYWGPPGDEENKNLFSVNALAFAAPRDDAVNKWNLTAALTVGAFDNKIMIGPCFDFGVTEWDRSRWGALLSFGAEF